MKLTYMIPLPPVTKKNSQRIVLVRGRPMIVPSSVYKSYEAKAALFLRPRPSVPVDSPVNVKCVYYMSNARRCDLTNLLEATMDVLVKHGILADDNYKIAASHDGSRVEIDREMPRTEIEITNDQGEKT